MHRQLFIHSLNRSILPPLWINGKLRALDIGIKGIVNCQNTLDKGVLRMQQWPLDIPQ